MMLRDREGVSYGAGFDVSAWRDTAVRVADFAPPTVLSAPESFTGQAAEVSAGFGELYGGALSRHAEQLFALKFLRDQVGFDDAVFCRVKYSDGDRLLFVHVNGDWGECDV
jgi:hypothetical protein